jgi:hypothetical protein
VNPFKSITSLANGPNSQESFVSNHPTLFMVLLLAICANVRSINAPATHPKVKLDEELMNE